MAIMLKDLPIGSKIIDPSHKWEHKTENDYTGTGETKPVVFIVVAKNHPGYPENSVTLITEEVIAKHKFDNSTNRGHDNGSNHYGDSGILNALTGVRKFLNGSAYIGGDTNSYATTFYDSLGNEFKEAILETDLTNKVWNTGAEYKTKDKIFLPSQTELGGGSANSHVIGSDFGHFTSDALRIGRLAGTPTIYWTRSPLSAFSYYVRCVNMSGAFSHHNASLGYFGVRPALNLESGIFLSDEPNEDGYYELFPSYNLVKSGNKYYGFSGDELIETTPTLDNFILHDVSVDKLVTNKDTINSLINPSLISYYDGKNKLKLHNTVSPTNELRYGITTNGVNYKIFKDTLWVDVNQLSINDEGMTKEQLEAVTESEWSELFDSEAYKGQFKIMQSIYSEEPGKVLVKEINIQFTNNMPPIILNAEITPDSIHNEYATVNANVKDYEGDKVYFKSLIKRAGESEFVQVSPLTGWYERNSSSTAISQSFNHPYFNFGLNVVKIVVKDERGAESEWVGNVTYLNTDPTITITHDDTQMTAVIGDEDGDDVAYRLFINDEMVFDYTEFFEAPTTFKQMFDSSILNFGENNKVRLEVKDNHGGEVSEEINVMGTYRGLMFKNEAGKYFVDDKGTILTDLLFDGVLIGGQTSPTKKVTLENRNGFAIKNTKVNAKDKNFVTGAWVEISETEMPFNPVDVLNVTGVMSNLDTKDFYVRVRTDRTAHRGAYFYIDGKADPAE